MAVGDTDNLSICSDALILLGASPISSFTEGTDAAQACDRLYPDLRDTMLSTYVWSWTLKKSQIARLSTDPINEWEYAYQLPGDMLSGVLAVFESNSTSERSRRYGWKYMVISYILMAELFILITRQVLFGKLKCLITLSDF